MGLRLIRLRRWYWQLWRREMAALLYPLQYRLPAALPPEVHIVAFQNDGLLTCNVSLCIAALCKAEDPIGDLETPISDSYKYTSRQVGRSESRSRAEQNRLMCGSYLTKPDILPRCGCNGESLDTAITFVYPELSSKNAFARSYPSCWIAFSELA